jgi:hypothetical protein
MRGARGRGGGHLPGGTVGLRTWRKAPVACAQASGRLQQILDGGQPAPVAIVAHVETCLSCQGELARYRKVMRLLHQLRGVEVIVPAGIVAEVLAAVEEAANRRAVRSLLAGRRVAYGSAAAATGLAGIGLAVLAWSRTRTSPSSEGLAASAPGRRRGHRRRLAG